MRSQSLKSGLNLLLAVAVLVGSAMPPAVQHAHADGEKPHDHRAKPQPTARHQHPHRHSHHHHGEHEKVAEQQKAHRHLHLLGFDLHLPVGECPTDRENRSSGEELVLVRLLDTDVVMTSQQSVERLFVAVPSLATLLPETAGVTLQYDQRERPSSIPLCDSARGERSGVLLT